MKSLRVAIGLSIVIGIFLFAPKTAHAACKGDVHAIRVVTRDADGLLLPGMNVAIYHKNTDPDGNPYLAESPIMTSQTDAGGQTPVLCVPNKQAPYAVKVYQKNPNFGYFTYWDVYEGGPLDISVVDVLLGGWQVVFRDAQGGLLKNVVFDVYLQSFDVDGEPVIDVTKLNAAKLVASDFNTQVFGATNVFLNPGHYVIRVHGTGNSFFYFWDQEVNAEEQVLVEHQLSTMRFVFEDGFGEPIKNQRFSVYRQERDVRRRPIFGQLVAMQLSTGSTGKADTYLPPGTYAIRVAGAGATGYSQFNLKLIEAQYRVATFRLSGIRIVLRAPDGSLARKTKFSVATQRIDALGRPAIKDYVLKSLATGEAGYYDMYVPPGSYILLVGKQRLTQIDVFDRAFTSVDWPRTITFRPTAEITVTSPILNRNFKVRKLTGVTLPSYLGAVERVSAPYKLSADTLRRRYAVTMTASRAKLNELGLSARRIKIAFFDSRVKRWRLVGKARAGSRNVSVTLSRPGYVVLVGRY